MSAVVAETSLMIPLLCLLIHLNTIILPNLIFLVFLFILPTLSAFWITIKFSISISRPVCAASFFLRGEDFLALRALRSMAPKADSAEGIILNFVNEIALEFLPEKLVSNLRKHYDSLPLNYAQAGFEMKDVFLHIKLIEQAAVEDNPAIMIQEISDEETNVNGSVLKLTFACNSAISWSVISGALNSSSICYKKLQIFEKKGFTLGTVMLLVEAGQEKMFKTRIENALRLDSKKPNFCFIPFNGLQYLVELGFCHLNLLDMKLM